MIWGVRGFLSMKQQAEVPTLGNHGMGTGHLIKVLAPYFMYSSLYHKVQLSATAGSLFLKCLGKSEKVKG